ncbi:transposase, partial [Caldalkalibacillus thermarum]
MYRHNQDQLIMPHEFFLPFGGQLDPNNRWVLLAQRIPWGKAEDLYIGQLKSTSEGRQAFSVRMALGALIIKERLGTSDRETVEQIKENPYLQYFIGLTEFKQEEPFHHTMMTHF